MREHSLWSRVLAIVGLLAALAWSMLRSGFSMTWVPGDLLAAALAWPERVGDWMTSFYADSPLYIFAVRLFGIEDNINLIRLALVVSIAALVALAWWAWKASKPHDGLRAARLVLLAPVATVLFSTMGSYDAFTVASWTLTLWLWLLGSRVALIGAGVVLGIQHAEHAALGIVALTLTWLAMKEHLPAALRSLSPLWGLIGILASKACLTVFFLAIDESPSGRLEWVHTYLSSWTKTAAVSLPTLIWSLFAGLWLLVVLVWLRSNERSRWLLLGALAIGLAATIVSGDRPRVFVMVLLPSLIVALVGYVRSAAPSVIERRSVEALAWLAPPVMLAGAGVVNTNIFDNAYVSFMWLTGLG